jgi:hypothetical protein
MRLSGLLERRFAQFVDRSAEMQHFRELLDGDQKRIMLVWGEPGSGTTWLMSRMVHETALRQLRKAEVVWNDKTRRYDYLGVMRKIRDDLGLEWFGAFTTLVNHYFPASPSTVNITVEGNISVAEGARIEGSTVGDVAGVLIKNSMIVVPRGDLAVTEPDRMELLTQRFIDGLRAASSKEKVVLFFDELENMSEHTNGWMCNELMVALQDELLPNVRCVLGGSTRPKLDRELDEWVEDARLGPLGLTDIAEYLAKRGVPGNHEEMAQVLWAACSEGLPQQVGAAVDKLVRVLKLPVKR